MERLAIEAGCWSRPKCSKDTCSKILPGFGQASNRNTLGSMASVSMAGAARALVAGLSHHEPKGLIGFARALTQEERVKISSFKIGRTGG